MMPANLILALILVLNFISSVNGECPPNVNVHIWTDDAFKNVNPSGSIPVVYCYHSLRNPKKSLSKTWTSVKFLLKPNGLFTLYEGETASEVCSKFEERSKIWLHMSPFWQKNIFFVSPFKDSCIGIVSNDDYDIQLTVKLFDIGMFACFMIGVLLFLMAPMLSSNVFFHYGAGVSFGVLASLLVLAYILGKFMPKKSVFYSVLVASLSLSAYMWNRVYENFVDLIGKHFHYLIVYVVITSIISFAVCYYKGPVSNPRLLTLISWSIQLIGVLFMYYGCQLEPICALTVFLLFILKFIKSRIKMPFTDCFTNLWFRMFPPRIKFLTEDEYNIQGSIETKKALEQLREYCHSPECNVWKTISRLKSPNRFAAFVDGSMDHISDEELNEHIYGDKLRATSMDFED